MTDPSRPKSIAARMLQDYRGSWRALFQVDLIYKLATFFVLTPLTAVVLRLLLVTMGNAVMSDMEIARFLLGPSGWVCGLAAGSLGLAMLAWEQASLGRVLYGREAGRGVRPLAALRFAAVRAPEVVRLAARILLYVVLAAAPFLALAAATYLLLLREYDINYYLKEQPPEFLQAVGVGCVLLAGLAAVLLRLFTSWFFALPLVLWEHVPPRQALHVSRSRARGRRLVVLAWIMGWLAANLLVWLAVSAAAAAFGRWLLPDASSSLEWLALLIGVVLLVWLASNIVINVIGTTSFAAILFRLYWDLARDPAHEVPWSGQETAAEKARIKITGKRIAALVTLSLLLAAVVGAFSLRDSSADASVQVMAHRGASKAAPENTLAAFQQAIDDGADWIELDVQESADGEVVVFHDSDFMKLAGRNLKIWDARASDLAEIDIGSWFDARFQDQRTPTLREVLLLCKDKVRVNIELKYYGHDQQLEQRVADVVGSLGMDSQVMAMSLKPEGVRKMKALRPDWDVGLLMSVSAGDIRRIEADFLAVNAAFVSSDFVRRAHAAGKDVFVWTVNDAPTMSTMIGRGVDGLLTDRPALARSVLLQRAEMTPAERLLLELAQLFGVKPQIEEQ